MELDPAVIRDIREACADVLGPPEVPPITVDGGSETGVAGLPPAAVAALGVITDSDIWRFYVGRKRDMKATVESVRQYAEWRRDSGANEVRSYAFGHLLGQYLFETLFSQMLKIPFPDFQLFRRVVPHSYHKRDLEGHPIEIDRIGSFSCSSGGGL